MGLEDAHLGVVGAEVFGDSTLAIHQEGVPAPLLGQGCLVAFCHKPVQLTLLGAHNLHILKQGREMLQIHRVKGRSALALSSGSSTSRCTPTGYGTQKSTILYT